MIMNDSVNARIAKQITKRQRIQKGPEQSETYQYCNPYNELKRGK